MGLWEFSVTTKYRVPYEINGEFFMLLAVGPHKIAKR